MKYRITFPHKYSHKHREDPSVRTGYILEATNGKVLYELLPGFARDKNKGFSNSFICVDVQFWIPKGDRHKVTRVWVLKDSIEIKRVYEINQ